MKVTLCGLHRIKHSWIYYTQEYCHLEYRAENLLESESHSVMLYSTGNSPGQNTGVDSISLLQGIFPTQELNQGLLNCRQILYQVSYQGSPLTKSCLTRLQPHGPARPLCPWYFPSKNTRLGCHILLQGIRVFCIGRWILYHLNHLRRTLYIGTSILKIFNVIDFNISWPSSRTS